MTANTAAEMTQDVEATDAMTHVRKVVAKSGTSFLWGMRILPRARRDAMYAIYAFCREVDDIADEPNPQETKLRRLGEWRGEIARLYAGKPREAVAQALLGPIAAFELPTAEFLAIIDGMEMDVRSQIVAPSMEDYALYCRRVAGAVGLLSIRVFGDVSAPAQELAVVLGEGLQTINILRDLDEDAGRGRLYLPGDLLTKHGMADLSPDAVLAHPNLPGACEEMTNFAEVRMRRARILLSQCDRRRMRPARLMLESYERILHRLEARGWDRPRERVRLSRPEKLWVAFRYSLF